MNNDLGLALITCCLILSTCGVEVTVVQKPYHDVLTSVAVGVEKSVVDNKSVSEILGLKEEK